MKSARQMLDEGLLRRADAYTVKLEDLHEEPGFNLRDEDAVDEDGVTFEQSIDMLADYIEAGGTYPPLEVRPRDEGGMFVVDGHRRRRALNKIVARNPDFGKDKNGELRIRVTIFQGNNADRIRRIMTSAAGRKLSTLEIAQGYKKLRNIGLSPQDIAAAMLKSVAHVNQLLTLADANVDVHQAIKAGDITATTARKIVAKHGENAGQVIAQEKEKAAAAGKKKVTEGTIAGKTKRKAANDNPWQAGDLLKAVRDLVDGMTEPQLQALAELADGRRQGNDITINGRALLHILAVAEVDFRTLPMFADQGAA